jgi:uncharacterized protein YceK
LARRSPYILLATMAALAGCGGVATQPAPTPSPSDTATSAADQASVEQITLAAADLKPLTTPASAWTVVDEGALPVSAAAQPGCLTHVPKFTAAYGREFSYGLNAAGLEQGHGEIIVEAAQSAADITLAQTEVATTTYQACYETDQIRGYLGGHAGVTMTGATTRQLETVSIGVPDVTMTFTTPFKFQNQAKVDYTVVSWTSYDRYRVVSWVQTCCGRPKIGDVSVALLIIAQRMQAAATRQVQ